MRAVALLLLVLSLTAAELEQITLTDGRRLIGYYDEAAGKLTVEGPPKVVLSVTSAQVASRAAYVRPPETDPAKRDAAELVRLEAEREAALADVTRLRKFASTRAGKDAEVALAQADERAGHAKALGEKIDALRQRAVSAGPKIDAQPVPPHSGQQSARQEVAAAMAEVHALRDQAAVKEFDALVAFLEKAELDELPVPALGNDPRQSEIEKRQQIMDENGRRQYLREQLGFAASRKTHVAKEAWSKGVLAILDTIPRRSAHRDQEEAAEREEALPKKRVKAAR